MYKITELIHPSKILKNSHKSFLMEKAIHNGEGHLGPDGELVINTGLKTGRSSNDKYVVVNEITKETIWWENNIHKMTTEVFNQLSDDVVQYLNSANELYITDRSVGSVKIFSIGIEFVSTCASAALFSEYIFKPFLGDIHNEKYRILHVPNLKIDPEKYGVRSETVIVTCFKTKTTIIIGSLYSGEIKKSMFCVMNYLLPDVRILPMHSGANQSIDGESSIFFGLSGTGKTTLSTDEGLKLIGDDEHGLSEEGVFNFEGGCYAKTYKLSFETEPSIYKASTQYSSYLENVKLNDDGNSIYFFDKSLTENGRATYPLSFISNRVETGLGKIPKNIFYLSADAFGVLPPVSLLTKAQAIEYFVLGYSAKLAGTEVGVKTPSATFSPCFGAPFMLRRPEIYSKLLSDFIEKYKIKVWLINTGWYGGVYGTGSRFPLKVTRNIIREIQNNDFNDNDFIEDQIFNLKIPKKMGSVDPALLTPQNAWGNQVEYIKVASQLASDFKNQLGIIQ
jgi:phosphoenolpyruvate carboxykinase (ATP)